MKLFKIFAIVKLKSYTNKNNFKKNKQKIVNVLYVKSKSISNNQEKENCKKIIQNLETSKNHLSYLDKIFELLNVKRLKK